ncbi:hypothetical protein EIK77_006289 [Talaromyces pinophilus]|nr:hypothetical protein EIK77_006289 [Talaromyces pinophilus]
MSQPPSMTQSSPSASGTYSLGLCTSFKLSHDSDSVLTFLLDFCLGPELSFDMLLEKAIEKGVGKAIVEINEATIKATDNAVENAIENSVEWAVDNVVENAVEDAVQSAVESAIETAVEKVIEGAVEKAVENTVSKAVKKAVQGSVDDSFEKAFEKSIAKLLDRSHVLAPSQSTEQRNANQNVSQTDVVSEIPETQQESLEIDLVTEHITEATEHKDDDDSEHEKAAFDALFAREPKIIRQSPWSGTALIEVFDNFDFFLAVNKYRDPVILSRECARGYQLRMCLWDFVEAGGWLHLRNRLTQKFLGIDACQSNGEGQFLLCLFDDMKKETRFCVRSTGVPDGHHGCLQIPIGSELHLMKTTLDLEVYRHDGFIEGEIHLAISERLEGAMQIMRFIRN